MTTFRAFAMAAQLAGVVKTLRSIYPPDPILPAAMTALLDALEVPPAHVLAAASNPTALGA